MTTAMDGLTITDISQRLHDYLAGRFGADQVAIAVELGTDHITARQAARTYGVPVATAHRLRARAKQAIRVFVDYAGGLPACLAPDDTSDDQPEQPTAQVR